MSYADDMRRWHQAVKAAKAARMPPPAKPDPPRAAMRARRRRPQQRSFESVAESLWGKLLTGAATPAPGIVPYSMIPKAARDNIQLTAPPVGWDPGQLDPAERALLNRLVTIGRAESPASELTPEQETELGRRMQATERASKLDDLRRAETKPWR